MVLNRQPLAALPTKLAVLNSITKVPSALGPKIMIVLAFGSSGPAYGAFGARCVKRAGGTWERPTAARRCLCARVRPPAPDPRQGTLVTSRMEVRSALGPAITRAGGIKSPRRTTSDHEDPLPRLGVAKPAH